MFDRIKRRYIKRNRRIIVRCGDEIRGKRILLNKMGKWISSHFHRYNLLYATMFLIWVKSVIVQRFVFILPIEDWYQETILLLTPISSTLLMIGFALFWPVKKQPLMLVLVSFFSSFILFANMVFYRFFNDFITVPVLFQSQNMGDLGESIIDLLSPLDFLVFLDVILLAYLVWGRKWRGTALSRPKLVSVFTLAICVFMVNWSMAEVVRPELLTRTFDRHIMVKSLGAYNYHLYDIIVNSRMSSKKVFASSDDVQNAQTYLEEFPADEIDPQLFGVAAGRNVIYVSMESLQSFVIEREIDGQELTPFLNQLIQDEHTFYFDNFYHQTGQGKTSDAEFMMENSLYPLPSGAVFFTHANNQYDGITQVLEDNGYHSYVFHANDKSFWNRDLMYQNLGYDRFFSLPDFEVTEENSVGWGLKDIPFFEQSVEMMSELPQPFYSKLLTLTNHYPFELDEEDQMIPQYTSGSRTLNRYVTTVRYLDESMKHFFEEMKQAGLYENSIFILYGDHYGISQNHNRSMAKLLEKDEITPYDHVQLQRVPLFIHIPGVEGERIDTVAGQVDVRPTVEHLLGIEREKSYYFGHDLFASNREPFVVLRDGSFVTEQGIYTEGACYDRETGEETDSSACDPLKERAINELQYSDEIIYGDLMRFLVD